MSPKLKAIELVDRMRLTYEQTSDYVYESTAIECALIAVNEILEELFEMEMVTGSSYVHKHIDYWQEVKQELKKLK